MILVVRETLFRCTSIPHYRVRSSYDQTVDLLVNRTSYIENKSIDRKGIIFFFAPVKKTRKKMTMAYLA